MNRLAPRPGRGASPTADQNAGPTADQGAAGRQRLLQQLKARKESRLGAEQVIERRGAATAPLSFGQQRLWFLEQFEPGNPRFNMLTALRLRGRLAPAAICRSLAALVARHEVLRTTFVTENGRPLQVVAPRLAVAVPMVDLAALPAPRREPLLDRFFRTEAHRPFDLEHGPLLRACLLRLGEQEHVLLLGMHQITVDRWSRGLSVGELTELYASFLAGRPPVLPALSIQYADYAYWQRQRLTGEVLASLLAYWRGQLGGDLPVLALPCDRPRPAVQTFRGGNLYSVLPMAFKERLERCGQSQKATLFMVLLAGVAALLARLTGAADVVLGSPVANRRHRQIEPLIGFFLNMLVLRVRLDGDPTFSGLLDQVRDVAIGAFTHQDLPFEQLVEHLAPARDLSRHPLFQAALVLQNAPMPAIELPRLTAGLLDVDWGTATYDLSLFFWETALWERLEAGLSLIANYNADLFDAASVRRLAGQLENLLRAAEADPGRRLSELALLGGAERHQILHEWSGEAGAVRAAARDASIHRRFELAAERHPDRVAVEHDGEHVSYGELDRRANRLAGMLPRGGGGPEPSVAVCLEPSVWLVTAILAALKAGCAYLPLDPQLPAARLAGILDDAGVRAVITREALAPRLPASLPPTLFADRRGFTPAGKGTAGRPPLGADGGPEALAYVVYTSGSTGRPKPVGVPHRAVVRRVVDAGYLALGPDDRVAQAASPSFDAFTFELWAPLLQGATLVILGRDVVLSAHRLEAEIRRLQLSVAFLATALFSCLAAAAPEAFAGLRCLLFGGEAVDASRARAVLAADPPARLLHLYGPTEATVFSSWHEVRAVPAGAAVPAGRPLAGTRLYVLDPELQPAGIGIEGEVHISGPGLARGYLGCPAETAAAFLPDPFALDAGERCYRTGDRARFLAGGELELRGRRDQQIKIRGCRVEPAEVQAALLRHPAVAEAAVVAGEVRRGERALVAYVVPRAGEPPPAGRDLVPFLRRQLPLYMVPAAVVALSSLPRTAGGKLDRAALPPVDAEHASAALPGAGAFEPPATAEEKALAAIWSEVLGRGRIGVHDDFFALGGHSLHVVEVLARVHRGHGTQLAVRDLYESPSLASLALVLAAARPGPPRRGGLPPGSPPEGGGRT
ncbi:MAG TPA: amino acid adenylation domain-containing protein [Thermoanaerobaculia bacterium]|nr:amino acid adenylation domain-containing protein [Thermoanaerobaculia bacterium]